MITKEEYIKKIKTKIKRTKVTVESWYTGQDMSSKIKDLDLDIVVVNDKKYFDIRVKQIEVCHNIHNVEHHFLYRPLFDNVEIKDCKYLNDNIYAINYLMNVNSYGMWDSHFRETIWCISKALGNVRYIEDVN